MKVSWDDYSQLNGKIIQMFQTTHQMMIAIMVDWWLLMITITLRIITNGDFGDGLWHCFNHITIVDNRLSSYG